MKKMEKSKDLYIAKAKKYFKFNKDVKTAFINQINKFYELNSNFKLQPNDYNIGDFLVLKKHTFLHGARSAMEHLDEIKKDGIISQDFITTYNKNKKTPFCASMWNIQKEITLGEYVKLYSGATVTLETAQNKAVEIKLVSYGELDQALDKFKNTPNWRWIAEQTKESRFMPSLSNNKVDIAFIFNTQSQEAQDFIKQDVFNLNLNPKIVKTILKKWFYKNYIYCKERTALTTNRESAILFGMPSCFIEGILVSKELEKNLEKLKVLKEKFPKCYIANLEGKIIM